MIKINRIILFYFSLLNLVCCLNSNFSKNAYILYSPQSTKRYKSPIRRWNNPQNNNIEELQEDEDLIKYELPNRLSSIIYKKRKNKNKKMYILNNENHVILPSHKISNEYKKYMNPIDYNYEEMHVYMEINTGSVNEKKNEQGISHLCEHVSYMGSKNRKNIIDKNIRTNAYTDFHHIVFYISVSLNNNLYKENSFSHFKYDNVIKNVREDEIENYDIYTLEEFNYKHTILSKCIDTMVEVLKGDTQFNKERIIKEKKAIFSEYSIINTLEYKMNSDIIKTLHKENRLSHRLPIGKLELLKRYQQKDIKQYFDLFFRTENVNLYVYGDINVDICRKLISEKFQHVKKDDLTSDQIKYLNILNDNTLRSRNKNLPAIVHMFGQYTTENEHTQKISSNGMHTDQSEEYSIGSANINDREAREGEVKTSTDRKSKEGKKSEFTDNRDEHGDTCLDDNIIDAKKLKEYRKEFKNEAMSELKFRAYLNKKYKPSLEEEKTLNKPCKNTNIITDFEIIKYSLNNVNINILLKEEIKSIRTMEDYKVYVMKDVMFYCLSFRFNIYKRDLFNSIDINEYTNINEGATIRTVEIKTTTKSFPQTVTAFYNFIKSLRDYGFSNDELQNYRVNEIQYDEDSAGDENPASSSGGAKHMKLTHPENEENEKNAANEANEANEASEDKGEISETRMNEMYSDEIQKIIDYNSCKHIYLNEVREKKLKQETFDNLKIEEINAFAKIYFEYLFNIFNERTNFKPNCVIIHVPHNDFNLFNKADVKKLFINNINSLAHVPDYSINIQNTLLSNKYIYENITKNLHMAKYVQPKLEISSKDIFTFILNKINPIKLDDQNPFCPLQILEHASNVNSSAKFKEAAILDTAPNFPFFQSCYGIDDMQKEKLTVVETTFDNSRDRNMLVNSNNKTDNKTDNIFNDIWNRQRVTQKMQHQKEGDKMNPRNLKNYVLSKKGQEEIEHYELKNGIKVNLYNTQIDKKHIYLRLIIPHNDILKKKKENVFTLLFSIICLFEGGEIENISRENVEIHCSNKSINICIDVNDEYFFIDIFTYNKYDNINSAFSILNNILLQTRIEESSLQRVVDKLRKDFYEYKNSLQSFLLGQTISYLSDGAIGYQNFDIREAEKINLETVKNVLKHLFSDSSLFELTVVGNLSNFIHYYVLHYLGTLRVGREENPPLMAHDQGNGDISISSSDIGTNLSERGQEEEDVGVNQHVDKYAMSENGIHNKMDILFDEYNLLCPLKNFEKKSKEITYVYLKEKEDHAVFLLMGKSANHFGFLSNGIHISLYLLHFLRKVIYLESKEEEIEKDSLIELLYQIRSHINLEQYKKENFTELLKKKKKLYTNPLFFNAISYVIQYILNSKLFHYLREKKELTYDSSFEFLNYEKYFAGFFTLFVQTNPKDLNLIKNEVLSSFHNFTKNYYNYSDYLIENAKLSYLNKKTKDLKFFIDKISGMQLTHFPLKHKNKFLLKDNLILNKIEKLDVLLVLYVIFNQTQTYHISCGITSPQDMWTHVYKNINHL
ncbi:stromal-processing peptidase [Plasmodium gonderi]|uniref:Stromal-processing peptidase n=1 Tax=Plasmodium gonderi TaxID=77519 RepID=A0A1Y1JQF8_PLAGO|nr:stromal-processing peptidase [Plasmodium gonderi]GAW82683.1 stromal-processing peptidase [Plasmodium gonderi]